MTPPATYDITATDIMKIVNGMTVETHAIATAPKQFLIDYLGFGQEYDVSDLREIVREWNEWVRETRPARTRSLDAWVQSYQAHLELEYGLSAADAVEAATRDKLTDLLIDFPEDPEGAADRVMRARGAK